MDWDYIIVGSGFGASVSALRLTEKGYRVLVLEKGRRLEAQDFPRTNWNLKRFFWLPQVGFRGLFKMTFLGHVTALSGVGVGGGSLVYANTLPIPKDPFFQAPSWSHLADWKAELAGPYQTVLKMLGAARNPNLTYPDAVLKEVGRELGRADQFELTQVAVHFGRPGEVVPGAKGRTAPAAPSAAAACWAAAMAPRTPSIATTCTWPRNAACASRRTRR